MPMKRGLKILAVAALALLAAGCGGKDKKEEKIPNDGWMLSRWNGSTDLEGKVYVQFNEDQTFTLYQNIDQPGFRKFTGTYTVDNSAETGPVLSGAYADATPWESSYVVEKHSETELQLRAQVGGAVSLYTAVVVPAYAKDGIVGPDSRAGGSVGEKPFL